MEKKNPTVSRHKGYREIRWHYVFTYSIDWIQTIATFSRCWTLSRKLHKTWNIQGSPTYI
jgi:hypothetical protein